VRRGRIEYDKLWVMRIEYPFKIKREYEF